MLELIIIGSLCVLGLYAAMSEGMVLAPLRLFFELITDNKILRYLRPALYECPICMASIWGTAAWLIMGMSFTSLWVLYIFGVAGFNYVMINMMDNEGTPVE
jgi:hypothetical protein